MVTSIAYGGTLGTSLFRNSISASPYLAYQYGYSMVNLNRRDLIGR